MTFVLLRLPSRKVNSLVYARVSLAHKDMEPELECFDAQTRKAEGFGELKGGFLVRCSLKMSRKYVSLVLATLAYDNDAVFWIQTTSCYLCSGHAFLWTLRLV
jgi:exosome complex RNA-binding protein Rrp4